MKTVLAIFIALHGLIHFMGFIKAFRLAELKQLKNPISQSAGLLWLIAGILFISVAVFLLLGKEWWWVAAVPAIILSQVLIISVWQDARFGTIANVIAAIAATLVFGSWNFQRAFVNDYQEGLARTGSLSTSILTENDIQHLPAPVQRYIRYTGSLGHEKVHNIKLCFDGQMRDKGLDWFNLQSEQYNFFDTPTRLFYMTGKMKGLTVPGYHAYRNGNASMQVKLFGLLPVVDSKDGDLNQAETVTFLNDMCLMAPATLIDERIKWEEIDSLSSKAVFTCNGITVSAILYFNDKGQLVNFISDDRFAISGKKSSRQRFSTPVYDYKNINGINVCSNADAVWHYPEGEFVYGKFKLRTIEYNVKDNNIAP
ncbi:MAG: SdpI family protein [Bacteroidales bacterium]|nr:SdpI family protein [Bacteroidales bacterium]